MASNVRTLPVGAAAEKQLLNRAAAREFYELRAAFGVSQLLWSIELGISIDSVQRYETGDVTVPAWVILAGRSRVDSKKRAA